MSITVQSPVNSSEKDEVLNMLRQAIMSLITPKIDEITSVCFSNPSAIAGVQVKLLHRKEAFLCEPLVASDDDDVEPCDDLGFFSDKTDDEKREAILKCIHTIPQDIQDTILSEKDDDVDNVDCFFRDLWSEVVTNVISAAFTRQMFLTFKNSSDTTRLNLPLIREGESLDYYRISEIDVPNFDIIRE